MKKELMQIWKETFHDSDAFIELFFERVYKEENVLVIQQNEQIVSSLHMVPYLMNYKGVEIPVSYICGAATDPSARKQGLMGQLLNRSFEVMKERGIPLTVLIPANAELYNYYQHFGYKEVFYETIERFEDKDFPDYHPSILVQESNIIERIYPYFDSKQRERICSILHDLPDFETIYQEHIQDGTWVLTAEREGKLSGFMFAIPYPEKECVFVSECFADTLADKQALLSKAFKLSGYKKVYMRSQPTDKKHLRQRGMIRIADREGFINQYGEKIFTELPLATDSDDRVIEKLFDGIYPYMNLMHD